MGATNFSHKIDARNAREAFDKLIAEANQEYGTASYNGSINTCSMGGCKLKLDKVNETNLKKANKFIDDNDYGEKWTADYVDVGVKEYLVTTIVKKASDKPTLSYIPKLKMQYCIYTSSFAEGASYFGEHFDTKTEADKRAMTLALKENKEYTVRKEYVNINPKANSIVTKIEREYKTYKSKPNLKPLPNRKVEEIHTYIFYGWASC